MVAASPASLTGDGPQLASDQAATQGRWEIEVAMGFAAPRAPVSFYPPLSSLQRTEAELRRLDRILAEMLGQPERLTAPWFDQIKMRRGFG